MNNSPLLSIIMPVKNNYKFFPIAVKSILDQDFSDWELIILEGYSTDGTTELADNYAREDSRIKTLHNDEWIYEKINIGLSVAEGKYFTVLNSDDKYAEDTLKSLAPYMYQDIDLILMPVVSVVCDENQNTISSNEEGIISRVPYEFTIDNIEDAKLNWLNLFKSGLLDNQTNIYKISQVQDIRFRNDVYGGDYLYNLRALPRMNTIAYSPKGIYYYYKYQNSKEMNASVAKYYDYQGSMYDDFYNEAINLFALHYKLTSEVLTYFVDKRINEFMVELGCYNIPSCPLSLEDKLYKIFKCVSEKKDLFSKVGLWDKLQETVLDLCIDIVNKAMTEPAGKMKNVKNGLIALDKSKTEKISSEEMNMVMRMVLDYNNPAAIGAKKCNELLDNT